MGVIPVIEIDLSGLAEVVEVGDVPVFGDLDRITFARDVPRDRDQFAAWLAAWHAEHNPDLYVVVPVSPVVYPCGRE